MQRSVTPKLFLSLLAIALLTCMGVAAGRIEFLAAASPLVISVATGLTRSSSPSADLQVTVPPGNFFQEEVIEVTAELSGHEASHDTELVLALPDGLRLSQSEAARSLPRGAETTVTWEVEAQRWGNHRLGYVVARMHGDGRYLRWEVVADRRTPVKVFPRFERISRTLQPPVPQVYFGNYVTRAASEGLEFAEVGEFRSGDRIQSVNWRVTSRRGALYVDRFHPERNADVVLFLDTFGDAGDEDLGSLDLTVRGAAGVAQSYLKNKDRVGLVSFGGISRWLTASMSRTQFYRIVDVVLESQAHFSYAWKDLRLLPPKLLPTNALVVAFSPLMDTRSLDALRDVVRRGFPLVIVDTLPEDRVQPTDGAEGALAYRVWKLHRESLRRGFEEMGAPVMAWSEIGGLDAVLAALPKRRIRASV